ncbi:hypothetical protein ABB02_01034 [Clostridiaceae bacterium JG1575]|nr:hypothetical protein ABB02_01034 [Clostridiaceae bacterium JG1575]
MDAWRDAFRLFFRGRTDGFVFRPFTPLHFALIAVVLVGCLLLYRERNASKQCKRRIQQGLFWALVAEQILQHFWLIYAGVYTLDEALPLYICRSAIFAMLLAHLTGHPMLRSVSVYWGFFGGMLASAVPVLYAYEFPHVTNFTFFAGHFLMAWTVAWMIWGQGYTFTRRGLRDALWVTTGFNMLVVVVNPLVGGNYSYFAEPPIWKAFFATVPHSLYILILFSVYALLITIIHLLGVLLQNPKTFPWGPAVEEEPFRTPVLFGTEEIEG